MHAVIKNTDTRKKRSGFSVFEAFISLILVSTAVSIALPTLRVVNLQRKTLNERFLATTTVANLAERLKASESWSSITPQLLKNYQSNETQHLSLTEPELLIQLIENRELPSKKHILINLSWQNPYGEKVDPVSLSLWFYQLEEQE